MEIRPVILWGMDPQASFLAEGFFDHLPAGLKDTQTVSLFHPKDDQLEDFRTYLISCIIEAKAKNITAVPYLALFVSAWDTDVEARLSLLAQICDILNNVLPGAQSIRLIVFLPSPLASAVEKTQCFKYFLSLEKIVGELSFLNIIFIHQLTPDLYRKLTSMEGKPVIDDDLFSYLILELVDMEMDPIIRSTGYPVINGHFTVAGRKCCYSTTGTFQLISHMEQGLAYLRSRFAEELFLKGYLNSFLLDDSQQESLRQSSHMLVDEIMQQVQKSVLERPCFPPESISPVLDVEQFIQRLEKFKQTVLLGIRAPDQQQEISLKQLDGCVRQNLMKILESEPNGLMSGICYMNMLQDELFRKDESKHPDGYGLFNRKFCLEYFQGLIETLFIKLYPGAFSDSNVHPPLRGQKESYGQWLLKFKKVCGESGFEGQGTAADMKLGYFLDLFGDLFRFIEISPSSLPQVEDLVELMISTYKNLCERLLPEINSRRTELEESRALSHKYSLIRRTLRHEAHEEFRQAKEKMARLKREINEFTRALSEALRFFLTVVNTIISQYAIRREFCLRFQAEVENTGNELSEFTQSVGQLLKTSSEAAALPPQHNTSTLDTILTPYRLEIIYGRVTRQKTFTDHALECQRNTPPYILATAQGYPYCQTLKDYFAAGADSLSKRLTQYSGKLFTPVEQFSALDVLETVKDTDVYHYLSEIVERIRQALTFSSALIPTVEATDFMHSQFILRSHESIWEKLSSNPEYRTLFAETPLHWLKSPDRHTVQVTCFIFGFPAFLIHALKECRSCSMTAANELLSTEDLWPIGHDSWRNETD